MNYVYEERDLKSYERRPQISFQIGDQSWYVAVLTEDDTHDPQPERIKRRVGPSVVVTVVPEHKPVQQEMARLGPRGNPESQVFDRIGRLMQVGLAFLHEHEEDMNSDWVDQFIAENNRSRITERLNK